MNDIGTPADAAIPQFPEPAAETTAPAVESGQVEATVPRFAEMEESGRPAADSSIGRFYDINIKVSAELGSVTMPIGHLLDLGEGSVVKLNRTVSSPVDVIANGIRVARGEVVVVDDCFAIRIKEIDHSVRKG